MAQGTAVDRMRCSYKKATIIMCTINVVAALYILHNLFHPLYQQQSALGGNNYDGDLSGKYSPEKLKRIKEAQEARLAVEPLELMKRVKEIQLEADLELSRDKEAKAARQRVASELAQRLKELKEINNQINQQALDVWRRKKLEEAKRREEAAKATHKEDLGAVSKVGSR
ncbi:hypothetical protein O6H91_05G024600 [Diphasiastrum complanatum]|uniref:Uncharacterized protein n=1 Tax=Diphasiastrum complanatum TaxID=34168 RepID=A0ACC2DLJ3_DIPCM|nr:hypothetical protein O6H91_05G024600 [Diphasiastrum complanatum]